MCDSSRAGAKGERQVKNPIAQVVVGPVSIRAQPRPRYLLVLPTQRAT
jgi:hypothetical protein